MHSFVPLVHRSTDKARCGDNSAQSETDLSHTFSLPIATIIIIAIAMSLFAPASILFHLINSSPAEQCPLIVDCARCECAYCISNEEDSGMMTP